MVFRENSSKKLRKTACILPKHIGGTGRNKKIRDQPFSTNAGNFTRHIGECKKRRQNKAKRSHKKKEKMEKETEAINKRRAERDLIKKEELNRIKKAQEEASEMKK